QEVEGRNILQVKTGRIAAAHKEAYVPLQLHLEQRERIVRQLGARAERLLVVLLAQDADAAHAVDKTRRMIQVVAAQRQERDEQRNDHDRDLPAVNGLFPPQIHNDRQGEERQQA